MGQDLSKAVAEAKKVLGKDAKIPAKHTAAIDKAWDDVQKQTKVWKTAKEGLEKQLLDLQNSVSKYKNALSQGEDELTDDNYGLNPKDKDDKKKIDDAQKVFSAWFKDKNTEADDAIKVLKEVDKHLMHVADYKGPS